MLRPLPSRPDSAPPDDRKLNLSLRITYLVALAKRGSPDAYDRIVKRYRGFVRLKASSYFLLGGDSDDLIQEGLVGLYKAISDFRSDRESSFRNFAELCITRQIITAVKTASRNKHAPLNQYVSFAQSPAAAGEAETTLEEILPGPISEDPPERVDRHRGAAEPGLLPVERALGAREPRPLPLPRRPLLRGDRRAPGVRHEDRRQRPPARQAQGQPAPGIARSDVLGATSSAHLRAEHLTSGRCSVTS